MNPTFLLASLLSVGPAGVAPAVEVNSPSGDLVLTVGTEDFGDAQGCPFYRLSYKGQTVIADSRLGLDLEPGALSANLVVTTVIRSRQDATWSPVCGERGVVRDHYNAVQIDLEEKGGLRRLLRLTFRVYDEGLAFCYTLPEQANLAMFTIGAERTQFAFTADHAAWAVYRAQGDYAGGPVPLSRITPGVERPLTIELGDGRFAAVTEARCVDYAAHEAAPRRRSTAYARGVPRRRARQGGQGERTDALRVAVAGRHGGRLRRSVAGAQRPDPEPQRALRPDRYRLDQAGQGHAGDDVDDRRRQGVHRLLLASADFSTSSSTPVGTAPRATATPTRPPSTRSVLPSSTSGRSFAMATTRASASSSTSTVARWKSRWTKSFRSTKRGASRG